MGGGSAAQAPTQAPADTTPVNPMATPEVGGDVAPEMGADPSSEVPFEKEPFDAGIEADENSDPKKYIEQLTGKLGQSLRTYTQNQGAPDFELEKFAVNSLLSATHTSQMDSTDQADIINKVETAGRSSDGSEDEPQGGESELAQDDDDADNIFSTGEEEPAQDDGAMNEMALTDHNTQKIIKLYNNGDDRIRAELNALVSMRPNVSKEEFLEDLQADVDYDELQYIISVLAEKGIELPDEENVAVYENESLFLENPPKNNMFQDGSNDKLKEELVRSRKSGLFVKKSKIRPKITESLNQDDMNEPATAPVVKPTTKPETKPEPKPSRKNKPFLPHVEPGTKTAPKAMGEGKHDYPIYHKTFSSAIQAAKDYVVASGYQISDDEVWNKISVGPAKPEDGKYNRYSLELTKDGKPQKKGFHIQVYNTGHNYELNCYVS